MGGMSAPAVGANACSIGSGRNARLAIFPWKKSEGDNGGTPEPAWSPQPEKAVVFFDRARDMQEAGNHEYAVQLWLRGLRFEPTNMAAITGLAQSMGGFLNESGSKKGLSKDTLAAIEGKAEIDKYLNALIEWMLRHKDPGYAVRAAELSAKLGFIEPTRWIAERAFGLNLQDKKPRKDLFLKLSECFAAVGSFDVSIRVAEEALKLNPADAELAVKIRNLSAQSAMSKGGYAQTGEAGGFRANVRDADKQRLLEESDKLSKTGDTLDRLIAVSKADHESRPSDMAALQKYVRLLLDRGTPMDENAAYELLMSAYMTSQQFNLRQLAGDIRIKQGRRKVAEAKEMLEAAPGDSMVQSIVQSANEDLSNLEIAEYKIRLDAYPTDTSIKYELGRRYFESGHFGECIEFLQQTQSDPKFRVGSLSMLGQAFLKLDYVPEAIEMFRQAADLRDLTPETEIELKYLLLCALQHRAETDRDLAAAEEAEKVASAITIKQFSFKDVRSRRDVVKKLIGSIRGG